MEQVIQYASSRAAIMAQYKKHGTLDPLRSPAAALYRKTFLWMVGVALGLFFASLLWQAAEWLFVLAALVLLGALLLTIHPLYHLLKARIAIERWATEMEKAGPVVLTIKENGFEYAQDGKATITPWSAVTSVQLHEDHIVLDGNVSFLFPKHAMTDSQYEGLVRVFREKTLEGLAEQQ
jgi:MFS family permease